MTIDTETLAAAGSEEAAELIRQKLTQDSSTIQDLTSTLNAVKTALDSLLLRALALETANQSGSNVAVRAVGEAAGYRVAVRKIQDTFK